MGIKMVLCSPTHLHTHTHTHTHTEPTRKQFTVLVIKPDAVQAGKVDEILEKVRFTRTHACTHTPHTHHTHHTHTTHTTYKFSVSEEFCCSCAHSLCLFL